MEGEGRFYSRDEDTLAFIKEQLIASAYKDIFTKEMKEMGLDSDKFWRNYEDKFSEYFLPIKETLEKKYGLEEKPNRKQKDQFNKALRKKRLDLKRRYGKLSRAIPKFSIKKMSRSPQVPNSRYIRLKAKVDRKEVNRIYLQFTAENPERHFSTLYMTMNFNLVNTSWTETGVEIQSDFTDVLANHWKEQLMKRLEGKIDKIIVTDAATTAELEGFLRMGTEVRKEMVSSSKPQPEIEGQQVEKEPKENQVLGNDFGSSLWLSMNFTIKKIKENVDTKKREFEFNGDLILQDLAHGKIIKFKDFDQRGGSYSFEDLTSLRNSIATGIANIPTPVFNSFEKRLVNFRGGKKRVVLEIVEYDSLGGVESLMKALGERGVTKQFSPMIESFTPDSARIVLEYAGADVEMISILRSLEGKELDGGRVLSFSNEDSYFQLVLKRTKMPVPPEEMKNENQKAEAEQDKV
jgi:hypothetical protein